MSQVRSWQSGATGDPFAGPVTGSLSSATGLPISTGVSGLGTGVATALAVNVGSAGAPVLFNGALGTPSSGTVTNLTGTASININGTVGATTPTTGAFTTVNNSGGVRFNTSGTEYARMQLNSTSLELMAGSTSTAGITLNSSNVASLTNNPVLTAGTANGVTYLNGSKVLTSGSALTFDGSKLGIGGTSPYAALTINGDLTQFRLERGSAVGFVYNTGTAATDPLRIQSNSGPVDIYTASGQPITFSAGGSEQMRLTSTGLGIGVSSPSYKLEIVGTTRSTSLITTGVATFGTTGSNTYVSLNGNGYLRCDIANYLAMQAGSSGYLWKDSGNSNTQMTLDASGNLGLGVTPSAWNSTYRGFELGKVGNGLYGWSGGGLVGLIGGAYIDSAYNFKYALTGQAIGKYEITETGKHVWALAASGTAGTTATFTSAMTLDASGNLGVGTTSPYAKMHATGTIKVATGNAQGILALGEGNGTTVNCGIWRGAANAPTTDGNFLNFGGYEGLVFSVGAAAIGSQTERARIDSSGNLLVGATSGTTYRAQFVCDDQYALLAYNTNSAKAVGDIWNAATTGDNKFFNFLTEAGGTQRGSITYNRGAGVVAYNTTSDYRAKDITGPVTGSGALIDSVPVYMGRMKGATQERPMFIAHETPAYAHTGVKDAVDADGNPVYQQMDASALIPVMWAEIQSLRARVAQLETN
jgi:hypothetical protein